MKTIVGFDGLLSIYKERPEAWYFFTDVTMDNKKESIRTGIFYLPDTRDEEEDMDDMSDKYKGWLEYATFLAIIDNKLEHHPKASNEDLLDAVIYYLEEDDFLD
ncbi:hypothetical protein ITQ18_003193 [Salmonella enterica subsp. enterica serovar Tennessee]|uniref:DUF7716 domain-containing protein n=7 Tax=Salmonella enterica TaxID=28901 RepID=A0A5U9HZ23_SALET|nr:hypothetical protein [Salmonella enterica]EAA8091061.1 hypothetical protein [Salmonella enterica subsp. enterica serovar Molade]EBD1322838.1 hypothetical protein [Salmonella enterica subsp. enterica serovar Choleraesuis]EBQ8843711.1 hypothetical protein [Salmonella enterica subsp. enterica serovar Derby]EBS2299031.1 hypothetical protein [Salmonella enterica subsp. enterica serovar Saintpaul]EBS2908476.1 hypothetical protein [Salmonella enterica subsp. enterica serovar Flottbek]EBS6451561.1